MIICTLLSFHLRGIHSFIHSSFIQQTFIGYILHSRYCGDIDCNDMLLYCQYAYNPLGGAKYINKLKNDVEGARMEVWKEWDGWRASERIRQICPRTRSEKHLPREGAPEHVFLETP